MKKLILVCALILSACGKTGASSDPLDAVAVRTCKDTIESRATNSKTVNYIGDETVTKAADGKRTVSLKFSAKNEIGMASTMVAACTVTADGKSMLNIAVKDTR
ncbi:MAG: hypothetical protein V4723_13045 [Pseudomonadota bacterium]